jgi:hypothetical protein
VRYFTRDEAEALLPRLEPMLRELRRLRADLTTAEQQIEALLVKMRGNGHAHQGELAALRARAADLTGTINERIRAINQLGVLVKDLEMGLIDFPARRAGHDILLCWRLDEAHIAWWHTLEGGFGARQPLED